ncbi:MAG: lactate utilization protein [Chloroflexi bacterium]|nr:lactate utilization protein [Chloroflexota bacterium]
METLNKKIISTPIEEFAKQATNEKIERTAKALEANGIHVLVAENAADAKRLFLGLVPEESEVFLGASVTLEQTGIKDEVDQSGRFNALRPKMFAMNRETQGREIRKMISGPDYAAGSVHAVTEDGHVLIASNTGSQLGPYASGAGNVIWVAGSQKIVKDLSEGFRRLEEHVLPLEEQHMQDLYKVSTAISKVLIVNREIRPNRITMIIVKEEVGY